MKLNTGGPGRRTDAVTMATVIMQGYQIFQPDGGGPAMG